MSLQTPFGEVFLKSAFQLFFEFPGTHTIQHSFGLGEWLGFQTNDPHRLGNLDQFRTQLLQRLLGLLELLRGIGLQIAGHTLHRTLQCLIRSGDARLGLLRQSLLNGGKINRLALCHSALLLELRQRLNCRRALLQGLGLHLLALGRQLIGLPQHHLSLRRKLDSRGNLLLSLGRDRLRTPQCRHHIPLGRHPCLGFGGEHLGAQLIQSAAGSFLNHGLQRLGEFRHKFGFQRLHRLFGDHLLSTAVDGLHKFGPQLSHGDVLLHLRGARFRTLLNRALQRFRHLLPGVFPQFLRKRLREFLTHHSLKVLPQFFFQRRADFILSPSLFKFTGGFRL